MRSLLVLMACLAVAGGTTWADMNADETSYKVAMRDAFPFYPVFLELDPDARDHIELEHRLAGHDQVDIKDQPVAWYEHEGVIVDLLVTPSGELPWVPALAVIAANPTIHTRLPADNADIDVAIAPNLPAWTEIDAWAVRRAVMQANGAMRHAGGLAAISTRYRGVVFALPEGAEVSVLMSDGSYVELPHEPDNRVIFRPQSMRKAVRLVFSAPPLSDAFVR